MLYYYCIYFLVGCFSHPSLGQTDMIGRTILSSVSRLFQSCLLVCKFETRIRITGRCSMVKHGGFLYFSFFYCYFAIFIENCKPNSSLHTRAHTHTCVCMPVGICVRKQNDIPSSFIHVYCDHFFNNVIFRQTPIFHISVSWHIIVFFKLHRVLTYFCVCHKLTH